MSYPTTVVSSQLCLASVRNASQACEKEGQLTDTVRFEATHSQTGLELFSLEFDVWAYTQTRLIETEKPIESVRCSFEHFRAGIIMRHEFSRSEEHTSELQSLMRNSYAVFCLKKKNRRMMYTN